MAGAPIRLAVVSQVDELPTRELERVVAAIQTQLDRDFASVWGLSATVEIFRTAADVPASHWPVLIQTGLNTFGYHAAERGTPYAFVNYDEGWSLWASHECLEMLADPQGRRLTPGPSPKPDQGRVSFLVQICDPCAGPQFAYDIDGVTVSDFVRPEYYGAGTTGPFDFTDRISRPFEVLPGGYLSWVDPKTSRWWQLTHWGDEPEFRELGPAEADAEEHESGADAVEEKPEPEPEPEPAPAPRAGRLPGAANDQVGPVDLLGFRDYVSAFVALIRSPHTRPPLTIGIFGSWGVGKSFLLQHIQEELEGTPPASSERRVHVVALNAWSYSASDAVWPALVRKVMECGDAKLGRRLLRKLWSNLVWELRQERGKLAGALLVGIVLLTVALWRLHFDVSVLGAAAAALGAAGLFKVLFDTLTNPLGRWVASVIESGDYGEDLDYMRRIRRDLEELSGRLEQQNARMLVVIDDLDRCEPDKIVEVLQAINLLLNFESFVVCLGIDARVVTRAIERHYEGLLQEAHASGYEYLDKIVQIPFRIPHPSDKDVRAFLSAQLGDGARPQAAANGAAAEGPAQTVGVEADVDVPVEVQAQGVSAVQGAEPDPDVAFTDDEAGAFAELAAFLEPNPRHLKRIVNVYRLVRSVATVRRERFVLEDPAGTIRLLALAAQWPYTLSAMFERLDEVVDAEAEGAAWPRSDPLSYLYRQIKPKLDRERQARLDRDLDDLDRLLAETKGRLSWKALASLRRYVVNFNPAVEEELRVARATAAATAAPMRGRSRR